MILFLFPDENKKQTKPIKQPNTNANLRHSKKFQTSNLKLQFPLHLKIRKNEIFWLLELQHY